MNIVKSEQEMSPLQVAEVFVQSGKFPDSRIVATAASKMIVGRGLGLTDYDSMAGLHIIKGKVVLAANTMAAAIKASGKYDYRALTTKDECTITFFSVDAGKREEIGATTFTMEDASNAGLRGDNWRKWPKAMLFARAISSGYREHCPDALGSAPVYVHEHGESEIPDDKPTAPVMAQRETPQIEDKKESDEDPKKQFIDMIREWCGCLDDKDCYQQAKGVLIARGVATDASASPDDFKKLVDWVDGQMSEGRTLAQAITGIDTVPDDMEVIDVKPAEEAGEEDPWGEA